MSIVAKSCIISTIDSHTAGHPTRVVTGGLPTLQGKNVAQKCDWFAENLDDLRTLLLHEPRGHSGMVGAVLTNSDIADFGAFFLGSYNYLPMCGHATIGLAATLDHLGLVPTVNGDEATFTLEVPAGIIDVSITYKDGLLDCASFTNVPAFVAARSVAITGLSQPAICDIAFGGNWYALVDAKQVGVTLSPSMLSQAMAIGSSIKTDINQKISENQIAGADEPIHSVLFYDTSLADDILVSRQLVVLAPNKFDRSPCGTGTSARLAQMLENGDIQPGEAILARNIFDVDFTAYATSIADDIADRKKYRPHIEGQAFITGLHTFIRNANDPLPNGFLYQ